MAEIKLYSGEIVLIDDEDLHRFTGVWHRVNGYALQKGISMHRLVLGLAPSDDVYVDHVNGNKLDNRKTNLRLASPVQNMYNRKRPIQNTSGVKGVSFTKKTGRWRAYISAEKKRLHLGYFLTLEEAEQEIRSARERLHGEFARHK